MKPFGILRNDKFLRGSDPATMLLKSSIIIYLTGVLNILLWVIALTFQFEFLQTQGFSIILVVIGFIFLVLGFFTQRRSLIALIIALIIYSLELVLVLFIAVIIAVPYFKSLTPALVLTLDNLVIIVILILFFIISIGILVMMKRGIGAINKLKKETPPTR